MNIVEDLLEWLGEQDEAVRETIVFQMLILAPDYKFRVSLDKVDPVQSVKEYLESNVSKPTKIIGKLLYIKSSFDFHSLKYGNIDEFLDFKNRTKDMIKEGKEGIITDILQRSYDRGDEKYVKEKEFKENWIEFRDQLLSLENLDLLVKDLIFEAMERLGPI